MRIKMYLEKRLYKNNKNGKYYWVLNPNVFNTTNANDEQIMVLYENCDMVFVREISEFKQKFTKV